LFLFFTYCLFCGGCQDEFSIDFDLAWRLIGYGRKEPALRKLKGNFEVGMDYIIVSPASSNGEAERESEKFGGNNRIVVFLTLDCFKAFCMMAGTSKGKEVRRYFLDCERRLKVFLAEESRRDQECAKKQLDIIKQSQD
jgi:hypothetical protein